jgi:hypothetical protein
MLERPDEERFGFLRGACSLFTSLRKRLAIS